MVTGAEEFAPSSLYREAIAAALSDEMIIYSLMDRLYTPTIKFIEFMEKFGSFSNGWGSYSTLATHDDLRGRFFIVSLAALLEW